MQNTSATSWNASGKTNGSYGYRVRACNSAGCSAYSATGTVTVSVVTAPTQVPTLTVPSTNSTGSYSASWTTSSGATRYELDEQANGGAFANVQNTSATSWNTSGKASGTYGYRVRACNSAGCSAYSALGTVVVSVVVAPTQVPTLTVPSTNSTGSYSASWTTSSGATRYELDEQVNGGAFANVQNTSATSWNTSGKASGTYGYRVRACNSAGCSAYSALGTVVVSVVVAPTVAPVLDAPTLTPPGMFDVTWNPIQGATTYLLERSIGTGAWVQVQDGSDTFWTAINYSQGTYRFRARGCNSAGCGPYSTIVTVDVEDTIEPFIAPLRPVPGGAP